MKARDIQAFAARDWAGAHAAKRAHWAALFEREGFLPLWTAAQELLRHARLVRPDFPTARDRSCDLRDHIALRTQIDRAANAFTGR